MAPKICILGAGVIGLATAVNVQNTTGAQVTIIADKFTTDTLSDGAAGIFRISSNVFGPSPDSVRIWARDSYSYYKNLSETEGEMAGAKEITGYIFSKKFKEIIQSPLMEGLLSDWKILNENEMSKVPGEWRYGVKFTTLLIECRRFLPWMTSKFLSHGGRILHKHVNSFEELTGHFDVVVNCTGFCAKYLCKDDQIVPIRGQVFKVRAPWIKNFYYGDYDTYIVPGFDTVTLGGTRQFDSYNEEIDPFDSKSIWERCCKLLPSLRDAVIERQFVGLRPHRNTVRLEKEKMELECGNLTVIHNYGHGGYGVSLAWGCGKNAADLVKKALEEQSEKIPSKL